MSKGLFYNRLAQVMHLVSNYVYPQPLSLYLGAYFKENKNLGSRDRKQIKEWFYAYFKSNVVIDDLETELIYILQHGKSPILEKVQSLSSTEFNETPEARSFPLSSELSDELPEECIPHLKSEKLTWVRSDVEPEEFVLKRGEQVYGLNKSAQIQEGNYAQIQDLASFLASKKVADAIRLSADEESFHFWDACSGAGGKSLAILSQLKAGRDRYEWYCSDKRSLSLKNAKKRLKNEEGVQFAYVDLSQQRDSLTFNNRSIGLGHFDAVLLDLPCSGSGTWGRNPQHLRNFKASDLAKYTQLQRQIVKSTLPMLKSGGSLFFVTCSTYAAENEDQLAWMMESFDLEIKTQTYIGEPTSDLLFWAHLIKKS
jgi:16S rRNA (cytosine967-C5)-methyltransferase